MSVGIDEAGKGSIIGSMFICAAICKDDDFKDYIFKDSKTYTKKQIYFLYENFIKNKINYVIKEILPAEIDSKNIIELQKIFFCELIDSIRPDVVYIDSPIKNTIKFKNEIYANLNYKPLIYCENKMDVTNKLTSVASIIAKYYREQHVFNLQKFEVDRIGSGYPSDVITQNFIRNHLNYNQIRRKWNSKIYK